jgi:hypothetical protein
MMMIMIAALAIAATIWAVTAPKSPHDLTMNELVDLLVLGPAP